MSGSNTITEASPERIIKKTKGYGTIVLLAAGILSIVIPTLMTLGRWSWSTETGAHAPIVLATGLWLIWHERRLAADAAPERLFPTALILCIAIPAYFVGRVAQILPVEGLACFAICIAVAALYLGWHVIRRYWFPIFYLMFILSPPENWVFVATRPVKTLLAAVAVDGLSRLGFNIAGTASHILIDGYQVQVAAACSGVNSIIGITAIGLFYIYLRHGSQPRYAVLLVALLLPVAIITNFIRVIGMILTMHWFGDGAVFNAMHDIGGIASFGVALMLLFMIDEFIAPLCRRKGLIR